MTMVGWRLGATIVVAAAGLVGCSTSGESPTDPTPAATLVGPTWRLTAITGQPVLDGTTVTAEFSGEGRVAGQAGCNAYFGSAEAGAGRLTVGLLASTLMACSPDDVMRQEARYLAALQASKSYVVGGDELRLGPSSAEVTLVFRSR